jgi:tripartite ATP-independent transporter DctP family solute receptor
MSKTNPNESAALDRRGFLAGVGGAATAMVVGGPASAQAPLTLRFASLYPAAHSASRTAIKFAELVEQKTGGKIKVELFHNASLGNEREAAEGVKLGSIDVAYSGLGGFGTYVREFGVLELPYLYESLDELKTVVDKITGTLENRMSPNGVEIVGYLFDGPRVTLSTRPLNTFADFKGLKFRVPQAPLYVQMAQAMGAIPTPIALPEIYTALQSRVADAMEGTPTSIYTTKYFEVAKNVARTDHIFFVAYIGMNGPLLKKLPADQQKAIRDAGREATAFNLQIAKAAVNEDFDRLKAAGVAFTTPDKKPFQEAVKEMSQKFAAGLGPQAEELYRLIKNSTGR